MENDTQPSSGLTQEQMMQEMYIDMRKAKNYMKWQLIITVALVVIPLLASIFIIPFTLKSLSNSYGVGASDGATAPSSPASALDSAKQLLQ